MLKLTSANQPSDAAQQGLYCILTKALRICLTLDKLDFGSIY